MKEIPNILSEKKDCCGCSACWAVCPKGAIEMRLDKKGFVYPYIVEEKCVGCMQCIRVCPIKKSVFINKPE